MPKLSAFGLAENPILSLTILEGLCELPAEHFGPMSLSAVHSKSLSE